MPAFVSVTFLDTYALLASLPEREGLFRSIDFGERILSLRGVRKGTDEADENFAWNQTAAKWTELRNTLDRLKRMGENRGVKVEFGRVYLEMLDPGSTVPWRTLNGPYHEHFLRAHLPLRTNPLARIMVGTESAHLLSGQLTVVNVRMPHSAVNLGEWPRVHLVCDWREGT